MRNEIKRLALLLYWHARRLLILIELHRIAANYNRLLNTEAWVRREQAKETVKQNDGSKAYAKASAAIRGLKRDNKASEVTA